jgi:hypothetical protein
MYKIIGGDGREYGPVTADQLRRWFAEGRANAQTRVQAEGGTEWKTLGELPEFADLAHPVSATPAVPPPIVKANAEQLTTEILARGYDLRIGDCVGRGWTLVMNNFWLFVGATLVANLIVGSVGLIAGPMLGGLYWMMLKKVRGQPAEFGDAFAGFSMAFLPLFLGALVAGILTAVGFILCVLPGIYLIVSWKFALPLIVDKKLDFWPAMECSRKVVSRHWWKLFGFGLVLLLVNLLGFACCFVGSLVSMPVTIAATMYAYEDIFGTRPAATA